MGNSVILEYVDGTKEDIYPTFDEFQALWRSGTWQGRTVAVVTHNGWPIKFRETKVELRKV